MKLLRQAGIEGWRANYPVSGYQVDVGFPNVRVAIEVDGLAFHSDADAFVADRQRQNIITLHGWKVLRFTWIDLTQYPHRVVAEIKHAIG